MAEQKALLAFIDERIRRAEALADDPVNAIIGAFHSGYHTTGEDAEDVLYGHEDKR